MKNTEKIMNIDIYIPARLDSQRLAQKHLKKINGRPIILHLIDRLKTCKKIRHIIVCTTNLKSDNLLVQLLEKENILYFRGNENDILQRFLDTSNQFDTDIILDVEGDDLYTDPFYVDQIATEMEKNDLDFVAGNASTKQFDSSKGFPHGLVPAGIRKSALEKICRLKTTKIAETGYKEFFMVHDFFKTKYIYPDNVLDIPKELRLTLDYEEDFNLAKEVFKELGNNFHFIDLLKLFQNKPLLMDIVKPVIEKWQKNYDNKISDFSISKN